MVSRRRSLLLVALSIFLAQSGMSETKAPTLVRDNRLDFLRPLPALGSGYSLLNNQVYSQCFATPISEFPSSYQYQINVTRLTPEMLNEQNNIVNLQKAAIMSFARRNAVFWEPETKRRLINVLLTVEVKSAGSRVATNDLRLSPFVEKLLKDHDLVQFHLLCGSHFLSAISQYVTLAYVLTYQADDTPEDNRFATALVNTLERLFQGLEDTYVLSEATRRQLRIVAEGIGMGYPTEQPPNIYPASITELRASVRTLERDMLRQGIGFLSAVEATSWDEFLPFLDVLSASGKHLSFRDMATLRKNAAFVTYLAHVMQTNEETLALVHKCSQTLNEDYATSVPEETFFHDVLNYFSPRHYTTLAVFRTELSADKIATWEAIDAKITNGANACFDQMNQWDKGPIDYQQIADCKNMESATPINAPYVKHYCLPHFVRP